MKFAIKRKQDLGRKCSAWKPFIPCLKWKSPIPKQILGLKKRNFGSKKFFGCEQKFRSEKKFWAGKNFGSEKILDQKILGLKNFLGPIALLVQKFLALKNFGYKKILGLKQFGS